MPVQLLDVYSQLLCSLQLFLYIYHEIIYLQKIGEYDECEWTDWLDQDNPSGHGDYERRPDGCDVQAYKVQLVSCGPIYDDVLDMSQCLIDSPYVACINSNQLSNHPNCPHLGSLYIQLVK